MFQKKPQLLQNSQPDEKKVRGNDTTPEHILTHVFLPIMIKKKNVCYRSRSQLKKR